MNKPLWARRIGWHIFDTIPVWRSEEGWFGKTVLRSLCLIWGHAPVDDHCGKPEHDYCSACGKRMPGTAAHREKNRE